MGKAPPVKQGHTPALCGTVLPRLWGEVSLGNNKKETQSSSLYGSAAFSDKTWLRPEVKK
ncbi:MAG: hypothetical protein IJ465_01215 [Clostridia bacterium]|nr:hypothetical protein [Clostridia bacterium]